MMSTSVAVFLKELPMRSPAPAGTISCASITAGEDQEMGNAAAPAATISGTGQDQVMGDASAAERHFTAQADERASP